MTSCCPPTEFVGANPTNVKWQIVRGDTSPLRVEFYENDETTPYNMNGWTFAATTYDFRGDILDQLEVSVGNGYVDITAPAEITALWGAGYSSIVAELAFDLQVTINNQTVWTPIIGTITVLGDVTGGTL